MICPRCWGSGELWKFSPAKWNGHHFNFGCAARLPCDLCDERGLVELGGEA